MYSNFTEYWLDRIDIFLKTLTESRGLFEKNKIAPITFDLFTPFTEVELAILGSTMEDLIINVERLKDIVEKNIILAREE